MMDQYVILTHHDAITGNNMQSVDIDYRRRVAKQIDAGYKLYGQDLAA